MDWRTTSWAWLLFAAALACLPLMTITWRRRETPGAQNLFLMLIGVGLWSLANGFQLYSQGKSFAGGTSMAFVGISILPPAWLAFALECTGKRTPRWTWITGAVAGATIVLLVATNGHHQWIWRDVIENGHPVGRAWMGYWIFIAYAYGLVGTGIVLLLENLPTIAPLYRWQNGIMALAGLLPLLVNVLYEIGILPRLPIDPTPLAFLASITLAAWALLHFRMLELSPVSPDLLMERTSDAVLVVDHKRRILSLNRNAEYLLGCEQAQAVGRPAAATIQHWPRLEALVEKETDFQIELQIEKEAGRVFWEAFSTPLHNHRHQQTGSLLMIRDITQRRQREEERERLLDQLQSAFTEIKTLSGLLPICACCKKIRDENDEWQVLEAYIQNHSEAQFSHGLCNECIKRYEPD